MRSSVALACAALTACAASPPPSSEHVSARVEVSRPVSVEDVREAGGEASRSPEPEGPAHVPLRRLELEAERCALTTTESIVVAAPCVLDLSTHDAACILPHAAMPHFVPMDPRVEAPAPGFTLSLVGSVRDVAASSTQVCIVDGHGSVLCRRPGGEPRRISELPPMTTLALGEGCGEILCGISEESELVCVATAARAGAVRVPEIAAVSVDGCSVCMASLDGRVACFGSARDELPFASPPRVLPGIVCEPSSRPQARGPDPARSIDR